MKHGYVIDKSPEVKPHGEFAKGLQPPAQLALKSSNKNIEVGKRRYQFQGSAAEISAFLEKNKDMKFKGVGLGSDGKWGVGKDPKNVNVCVVISRHKEMKLKDPSEVIGDGVKKMIGNPLEEALISEISELVTGGQGISSLLKEGQLKENVTRGVEDVNLLKSLGDGLEREVAKKGKKAMKGLGKKLLKENELVAGDSTESKTDSKSIKGKVRSVLTDIEKTTGNVLDKVPYGDILKDKISESIGVQVNIVVDTYINPNKEYQGTYINTGSPELTFGDLAKQINEKLLGKVNQKEVTNEVKADSLKSSGNSTGKDFVRQFSNPQVDQKTKELAHAGHQHAISDKKTQQSNKTNKQERSKGVKM